MFSKSLSVALCSVLMFISLLAYSAVKDQVTARTAPIGSLCMSGQECAAAPVAVFSGPRSAADIYNDKCVACHASGAAGAPKTGDVTGWVARIGKGIDVLYANAIGGLNGMPAKGLCMDCSDDEIKETVDYMIDLSQ